MWTKSAFRPACDAETVHVTFARSNWETPGIALQRQSNGEFMCIMGATDTFDELLFKVSVLLRFGVTIEERH